MVAECIQHISTGNRAGTTWIKPLALREARNATLARAAERFDPTLGWLRDHSESASVESASVVPSRIHIFSPLAPAAFVPTARCDKVPVALCLAVRAMSEAHAASVSEQSLCDFNVRAEDFRIIEQFVMLVDEPQQPGEDDVFYDPLR